MGRTLLRHLRAEVTVEGSQAPYVIAAAPRDESASNLVSEFDRLDNAHPSDQ